MAEEFRQGHYILGIEGLALLRAGARRSFDGIEARTDEIREVLARQQRTPEDARDIYGENWTDYS